MREGRLGASQSLWYLTQTTSHTYLVVVQPENRDPALEQDRVWNAQAQANALVLDKGWAGGSGVYHVGGWSGSSAGTWGQAACSPGPSTPHIHSRAGGRDESKAFHTNSVSSSRQEALKSARWSYSGHRHLDMRNWRRHGTAENSTSDALNECFTLLNCL